MKRRKPSRSSYSLDSLPTAFWLSSRGVIVPVDVHAETLIAVPEFFGLAWAPRGKAQIEAAMRETLSRGWIRARIFPGGIADFQIYEADTTTIREISDLLYFYPKGIDGVVVRTVEPWMTWPMLTLEEFQQGKHPSAWRTNPIDKKKT
jgi:hypothetical protein